jgi:hypothetical protein
MGVEILRIVRYGAVAAIAVIAVAVIVNGLGVFQNVPRGPAPLC